jgi:glucose/arabinose dehydrogenase
MEPQRVRPPRPAAPPCPTLRLSLVLLLSALIAACGTGGGADRGSEDTVGTPEGTDAHTVDGLEVETLLTGLDTPWEVVFAPDARVFITERPGTIRLLEDGELRSEPYAELQTEELGEGGQLGLALDPDFEENGYLYAYHTSSTNGGVVNRVVRLVDKGDEASEDAELLEAPAASIHNGGRVAIGPDGKLYATLGDVAEDGLAQDRDALAGKIVRLNLDGSVPEDNPFGGSPVYSYGHRNPQGLAWDESGNLYAPEHGPTGFDELNLVEAGENYGWPEVSGEGGEGMGFVDPVIESGQETWAPSGAAYVSQGPWEGSVLFTGLRGASLHRATFEEDDPSELGSHEEFLEDEYGRLRTVTQGPDGALYILTSNRDGRGSPASEDDRLLRVTIPNDGGS